MVSLARVRLDPRKSVWPFKGYFAMTFLSSSPPTPATQSGLAQLRCERQLADERSYRRSNRFRTVRADLRSKGESAQRRRSRQGAPPMMSREWELSRASGLAAKRLPLAPALRLGG